MIRDSKALDIKLKEAIAGSDDGKIIYLSLDVAICYLETMVDRKAIETIKESFNNETIDFKSYLKSISERLEEKDIPTELHLGNIITLYNNELLVIGDVRVREGRSIGEPVRESTFEGALEGFVENVDKNINIIRDLYQTPKLKLRNFVVGNEDKRRVVLLYNEEKVDKEVLKQLTEIIPKINVPVIQSLKELQQYGLRDNLIIPKLITTERADRTIRDISKGRIAILMQGSPLAMIAPSTFHDFMMSMDDYILYPLLGISAIVLRYLALIISIVLPAAYVAITSFNPELLRVQLTLSILTTRAKVPYPPFIEVLFMSLMMEFLVEASLRLPKYVGGTATTVGGLILGQAATQASLVSNIMIIIVAIIAITSFVVPITSMSISVRALKYILILFAAFGGLLGLYAGLFTVAIFMFSINVFSKPFINPLDFTKSDFTYTVKKVKRIEK